MKLNGDYIFLWHWNEKNEVCIVRAYGEMPIVLLPEKIAGKPVTEIGAYCFAQTKRLPQAKLFISRFTDGVENPMREAPSDFNVEDEYLHELSGKYIEQVVLPDGVRHIGNCAFYNCGKLKELSLSGQVDQIDSDVFMNCIHLQNILLRTGVQEKSGLKQILAQISWNLEVCFLEKDGQITAVLFYPEYYEEYDEIGPAHIFKFNLTGEGFRARQCFADGRVLLKQYDEIFPQACVSEPVASLCQMAFDRLYYPVELSEDSKKLYEDYIKRESSVLIQKLLLERKLDQAHFLIKNGYVANHVLEDAIITTTEMEWAEGTASLIRWKAEHVKEEGTDRYSFDDLEWE